MVTDMKGNKTKVPKNQMRPFPSRFGLYSLNGLQFKKKLRYIEELCTILRIISYFYNLAEFATISNIIMIT